jgi:hypothetical protein
MKIRPVGAELFYTDWQTDRTTLILDLHNSDTVPKTDAMHKYPSNPGLDTSNNTSNKLQG